MDEKQNEQIKAYYQKFSDKTKFLKNDYYVLQKENGYTSPPSSMPAHELKLLREYMHGINLKQLGESLPNNKKNMLLVRFLKGRRNQQVNVHTKVRDNVIEILGRVSEVGRDFTALTTVTERFWIPYAAIESAGVPYGISDMPNSHQQVIYDESLRRKLLTEFSTTLLKNDVIRRQFYEETLEVHLQSWKGIKIRIYTKGEVYKGKLVKITSGRLTVKGRKGNHTIPMDEIHLIKRSTPLQLLPIFIRWLKESFSRIWNK
ncbi:hypothetical protein [Bacillus sp. V5-8f]|uniref:hypothetical protein n=1 Tax=Bacillus sp. V5-8f TaxID=2053044 RepID=UPI000C7795FF|nr:hypothetical protein [Bacillus sp. V5-8f]PLT32003.1 hypothetical protein CUU64_20680 [Bacillus sp. V5-8f]